jgi:hypothetical protein
MQIIIQSQIVDDVAFCTIEKSLTSARDNIANHITKCSAAFDCFTVFAATVMIIALCALLANVIERAFGRVTTVNVDSPITLMTLALFLHFSDHMHCGCQLSL